MKRKLNHPESSTGIDRKDALIIVSFFALPAAASFLYFGEPLISLFMGTSSMLAPMIYFLMRDHG